MALVDTLSASDRTPTQSIPRYVHDIIAPPYSLSLCAQCSARTQAQNSNQRRPTHQTIRRGFCNFPTTHVSYRSALAGFRRRATLSFSFLARQFDSIHTPGSAQTMIGFMEEGEGRCLRYPASASGIGRRASCWDGTIMACRVPRCCRPQAETLNTARRLQTDTRRVSISQCTSRVSGRAWTTVPS